MPENKNQGIPFDFPILIKSASETEGKWIIEGIIATDDLDLQGEIITREALEDAASGLVGKTVLDNHNENRPIGVVLEASLREAGLWAKILISKTAPDVWTKIQETVINSFSFKAFVPNGSAMRKWIEDIKRFANVVSKIIFVECSLVSCPANPKATGIKWYISKALNEHNDLIERENGMKLLNEITGNLGDIGILIKDLKEQNNIKSDEMTIKVLEQIEQTIAKSEATEMISKTDIYDDVMKAIEALIGEAKSDAQKKDLTDATTLIARAKTNEYPEPEPEPEEVAASADTEEIVSKEMLMGLQKAHEYLKETMKVLNLT